VVQRLYHTSPAQSTPSAVFMGHPYSPHCPWYSENCWRLRTGHPSCRRPRCGCIRSPVCGAPSRSNCLHIKHKKWNFLYDRRKYPLPQKWRV